MFAKLRGNTTPLGEIYLTEESGVLNLTQTYMQFIIFLNVYLLLRERERECTVGEGRGTESKAGSRLLAVSTKPDMGLELTNREIMTCAKIRCLTNYALQVPHTCHLNALSS